MIKIKNKIVLGIISGLLGELVILLSNRMFVKYGLVHNSLNSMSRQVITLNRLIPITTRREKWLSHGISAFFCIGGGLLITFILTLSQRVSLLKGFFLGVLGGLIPYTLKQFKVIRDFKTPLSKTMCLVSHGLFGLTVALALKLFEDENAVT